MMILYIQIECQMFIYFRGKCNLTHSYYKFVTEMTLVGFQDNVFVNVVASIQYRALAEKANDAFYRLTNTRSQIQAYVFDGKNTFNNSLFVQDMLLCLVTALLCILILICNNLAYILLGFSVCLVIRGTVPKLDLDAAFEQKNDIAKAVEEELEKVVQLYSDNNHAFALNPNLAL